jgi:hypothetical protein
MQNNLKNWNTNSNGNGNVNHNSTSFFSLGNGGSFHARNVVKAAINAER